MEPFRRHEDLEDIPPEERIDLLLPSEEALEEVENTEPYTGFAFEKTDIRFRDVDSPKIEEVWVDVYHGGETPVPNEDIHLYLDNLVIARKPIGSR